MGADTMETLLMPPAPKQRDINTIEDAGTYIHDLQGWITAVQFYQNDLYNILHSGYLVRSWQVEELTAGTITSGTITASDIYLFDEHFQLNGANGQIVITDDNDTQRLVIGKFGAGTAYGIKGYKSDGTLMFNISDTVSLNGALITNGTLSGATVIAGTLNGTAVTDLSLTNSKYGANSITNDKVQNLSASKITLSGTLTCTSSTTAIAVTSSGVVNFSGGGDMIFKATASDSNFISFRNSSNSERGSITYSPSSDIFSINNANGSDLYIDATYGTGTRNLVLRSATQTTVSSTAGADITVGANITLAPSSVVQVNGNMRGDTNNSRDLGTASIKYANMWTVVDHVGDIEFDNGWRITEPDKVYDGATPHSGLLIMNDKWEVMGGFDREGNLWVKGWIKPLHDFLPPNIARRESKNNEEIESERKERIIN